MTALSSGRAPRPTDPKIKERIKALVRRAEALEEQELKANSKDVDALYCRGVTRAQFSVYTGLVDWEWFSALRNAVGARHDHEHVLEIDPDYIDAKMVVGTHNYVIGRLPWSVKVAAAIAGLSGSADKALRVSSRSRQEQRRKLRSTRKSSCPCFSAASISMTRRSAT